MHGASVPPGHVWKMAQGSPGPHLNYIESAVLEIQRFNIQDHWNVLFSFRTRFDSHFFREEAKVIPKC